MPRINNPKPPKRAPKIDLRRGQKKKPCAFCMNGVGSVDYKDLPALRKYISDRGKIRGRKVSGNCQQHQRDAKDREAAEAQRTVIEGVTLTIAARAGTNGHLFGSVTEADVVNALRTATGISLDRKAIVMDEHLKELGSATVSAHLFGGVVAVSYTHLTLPTKA